MELVDLVKEAPAEKLGLVLTLFLIYKLIDWWRSDLRNVQETLIKLTAIITKLTVLMEIQKSRKISDEKDEN